MSADKQKLLNAHTKITELAAGLLRRGFDRFDLAGLFLGIGFMFAQEATGSASAAVAYVKDFADDVARLKPPEDPPNA